MGNSRKRFAEPALKTWEDVDLRLKEIGELDIDLQTIEAQMNVKIADIKLEADMAAKPKQTRREMLALEIKEFVEANKAEIAGKTRRLNFGSVGFRQSSKIVVGKAKEVLAALKARNLSDCIKVKETIIKDALKKLDDAVLAAIGVKRKTGDVFWVEPDYEKLKKAS